MIDSTHIKAHRSASGGKGEAALRKVLSLTAYGRQAWASGQRGWEQNQAIGRSRGGRNTKIHAIADAKGRLLSILLSGGDAHDCPPAEPLIEKTKPARRLLADKAYDSAALRGWLRDRGTKPVIPNNQTESSLTASIGNPTNRGTSLRMHSAASRTSDVLLPATTGSLETSSHQSISSQLSYGGAYESQP